MQRFVVVVLIVAIVVSLLPPPHFAYAATFIEDTQSEFNAGTHSSTVWDTNRVQLSLGSTSGTFTSQVLDGGTTNIPRWDSLAWTEGITTTEILGVDTASDVWASIGTSTVWQLAKDDYNSTNGNGATDMAIDGSESVYILQAQDLWKSTNHGYSWTFINTDYNGAGSSANGINIVTDNSNNVFIVAGNEDVYKSTNGGTSFSSVASNFNGGTGNVQGMVAVGANLFAVDVGADVWQSTDSGATWTALNTDYNSTAANGNSDEMTADNSGNLYILESQDVWKSTDSGTNWTKVNDDYNGSESQNGIEIAGDASGNLYIVEGDEDIWKSTDGGTNWTKTATNINGAGGNFAGLVTFTVSGDVTMQVRSGSANPPTGSFLGPDGSTGTNFTTPGGETVSVSNNRYFQYRITFSSDSETYSPTLTSATVTYTLVEPITATASVDTTWIKGAETSKNIIFTLNNSSGSSAAIQWVRFTRPSGSYTITGGSASGWSSSASASAVTFTGGSISAGSSKSFTVILDAASTDDASTAWTIAADDQSDGASTVGITAASGSSISTGIDATAPTNVSIASVSTDSPTQVTATAASSTDSASGVHSATYWFDETTAAAGATDSTAWQGSKVYTDAGLTTGTQYCYRVKARDAVGNESAYSSASCATPSASADTTAPSTVTNLAAGSPAATQITLTWTAPGDDGTSGTATRYDLRYATSALTDGTWSSATEATGEPTPSVAGSSESLTITGLSNSTGYYFALKTEDDNANISAISNITGATTTAPSSDTTAPTISNVIAGSITSTTATISWTTNEAADSEVEFGSTAGYGQSATEGSYGTSHTIRLSNLAPNATYHYRVRSKDSSNNLASTADFTLTTNTVSESSGTSGGSSDKSGPIISDIIASTTYKTAIVSWKTQESATARIEFGKTSSYGTSTKETKFYANEHSVFLDSLEADTEYNFRVISADLLDNASFSDNQKFKTTKLPAPALAPAPPPPKISEVSVVAVRPTSAKITWKTDLPATSQIVFGTTPKQYKIFSQEFSSLEIAHDRTISDLIPGTTYYFQIVTRNERGIESRSDEGIFTTESIEIQTVVQIQKPNALPPGSPGTLTPFIVAGETTVAVPIIATQGDTSAPEVTLFDFDENPTQNTAPVIHGRARDSAGVIESVAYSSDTGTTWHPVSEVAGIGSSAATFNAKIPNLRDGNYTILFRSRDNSENIGTSNSRILIIDIKPPVTGANIMLMGSQSIIPSEFGTIETLSGITQRFVTTAIGGATSVTLIAKKIDPNKTGEEPATTTQPEQHQSTRIEGTIHLKNRGGQSIKLVNKTRLQGANGKIYRISSGELTVPQANGDKAGTAEAVIVADGNGAEFNLEVGNMTLPGLVGTEYFNLVQGEITSPIKLLEAVSPETNKDQIEFPLVYSKAQDVWFGDIMLPDPGTYQTFIFAVDGAERQSIRLMNEIHVGASGIIQDENTKQPVRGSRVTVYQYSDQVENYQVWPGEIFNQANPQITANTGEYRFILPPGKYYLKIEHDDYATLYSNIFTLTEHKTVNASFSLHKKNQLLSFTIPFIHKKISLPAVPNFLNNAVNHADEAVVNPPQAISQLIGKTAPLFSLPLASTNEPIDIRYLRGKKTILSTWSTWSPHSQVQIPILDAIVRSDPSNVRVLLVSLQQSAGVVETYLRRGNYTIPSVVDTEGKITEIYPIFSLPQHFFIDRKGIVREVHIGFLNEADVRKKLEQL